MVLGCGEPRSRTLCSVKDHFDRSLPTNRKEAVIPATELLKNSKNIM